MLPLKQDFFSSIKRHGCLPVSSLSEKLSLQSKLKQYEKYSNRDSEMGIMMKRKMRKSLEAGLVEHLKSTDAMNQVEESQASQDEPDFYSQVSRPDIGSQVLAEQLHDARK